MEEKDLVIATKRCEEFLKREERNLVTFTGDGTLSYIPSKNAERFSLKPREAALHLPVISFTERSLDDQMILWLIYKELALYPDWRQNTSRYLGRMEQWEFETNKMLSYLMAKIHREGFSDEPSYDIEHVRRYVKRELLEFIHCFDEITAVIRVFDYCPVYRQAYYSRQIQEYLSSRKISPAKIRKKPLHQSFCDAFLCKLVFDTEPPMEYEAGSSFNKIILGRKLNELTFDELKRRYHVNNRDEFLREILFPEFYDLWRIEIDAVKLQRPKQSGRKNKSVSDLFDKSDENSIELSAEDVENAIREIQEISGERDGSGNTENGTLRDLSKHGIDLDDQKKFQFYANKMRKEREEMRNFWKMLLGRSIQEVNVKKSKLLRGHINVDDVIYNYPDFVEAQNHGSYRKLRIYDQYVLTPQRKKLPDRIEVTILMDNSGSMDENKIEAARKALVVTLLSLEDFNDYLTSKKTSTHSNLRVYTRTYFFGKSHYKVKSFHESGHSEEEICEKIKSVVRLNGKDGSTDDASLLKLIADEISEKQVQLMKNGKLVQLIFEITDGCSNTPGSAHKAVERLIEKSCLVYAFQIGKNSASDVRDFNQVWNDGLDIPHGITVGEEVNRLPGLLLNTIKENMQRIFQ